MDILEKSSKEVLYDESNGCGKEFTQLHIVLEHLKLKSAMEGLTIVSQNF
jgi:hypothetical protein